MPSPFIGALEQRVDRSLRHAVLGVGRVEPLQAPHALPEARLDQEAIDVRADVRRGVALPVAGDANAVMHDAGGGSRHVRFPAAVDERRDAAQHALVDGADAPVRHRDVGVLQHVHLWHPGERVDPRRQRAEIGGRDPVAQADDQLPARTLLDDAEEAPQEGEVGREDRTEAGVDEPAVDAGLATPREDRVEPVAVSRSLRPVDA